MSIVLSFGAGRTIQAPSLSTYDYSLVKQVVERVVTPGVSGEVTVDDRVVDRDSVDTVDQEAQIDVTDQVGNHFEYPVTFESLDETIGTVDASGRVTRVSDGEVRIVATGSYLKKSVTATLLRSGASTVDEFIRWKSGSLAEHMTNQLLTRLNAHSVADGLNVFSAKDFVAGTYTRNASHWAADLDLTSVSPYNTNLGTKQQCTLITPRHYLMSEHYTPYYPAGTVLHFVKSDGTLETAVSSGYHQQAGSVDLLVGVLNAEPTGVSFMKVFPSTWASYLPTSYAIAPGHTVSWQMSRMGGARYNQDDWLMAGEGRVGGFLDNLNTEDAKILEFYGIDLRGGDSGGPGIFIVDGEPVLDTCWTFGNGGGGARIAENIAAVNTAIAAVDAAAGISTGYTVTEIDLSSFPTYS